MKDTGRYQTTAPCGCSWGHAQHCAHWEDNAVKVSTGRSRTVCDWTAAGHCDGLCGDGFGGPCPRSAADPTVEVQITHPEHGDLTLLVPWSEVRPLTLLWPVKATDHARSQS